MDRRAVPEISLLRNEEQLDDWKEEVDNALKFYGLQAYIRQPGTAGSKRIHKTTDNKAFVLGLLTTSILPVAGRLVKAGWDFSTLGQDPADLYQATLKVIVPPSKLTKTVADIMRELCTAVPRGSGGLRIYRRVVEGQRLQLDAIGCPLEDKTAVCLVLDALSSHDSAWHEALTADLQAGELNWAKLMQKITLRITRDEALAAAPRITRLMGRRRILTSSPSPQ
jgi:hypothetical protein